MIDNLQRLGCFFACLLILGGAASFAPAQDTSQAQTPATSEPATETEAPKVDERFASPEATMFTYLKAMDKYRQSGQDKDLETALLAFDFSGVDLAETQRQTAANLLNILNKINQVDPWQFPEPTGDRFVYFPQDWISAHKRVSALVPDAEIVFKKQPDGRWLISRDTVDTIPRFVRQVEGLKAEFGDGEIALTPAMLIRSRMPMSLRKGEVLSVEYWQWIGLGILIFLGLTLDLFVRMILRKIWRKIARKRGQETSRELLNRAVRPFGLFATALLWLAALPLVGLPPTAVSIILIAVRVVLMLSGVWAAYRVTDLLADFLERQADKTTTKLDDLLVPLARKTGKVIVTAFGLVYIAESFDVEILPLLTGLGIGGLAFAFAAKDTIENFFGSVAVILDQPFEVGDWVVIDGTEGTVEELGLRSTRIRTFYDSLITIPNATLVRARVDNYGKRRYRRFSTTLGVTYDTTPAQIEAFCEGIREIIRQHPYTRKNYFHVYLNSWGDFALNIMLYVFFECPDWSVELRERQRLMLDIMRLAERLGVSFAFPTQTLEIKRAGATSIPATLEAITSPAAELEAQRLGIETTRTMFESAPWKQSRPGPVVFRGASPTETARGSSGDGNG